MFERSVEASPTTGVVGRSRLQRGVPWYRAAMHDTPSDTSSDTSSDAPHADRPPTSEEERVADEVAADVDLDRVAEHYEEAIETGAHVRGEGQIEPDPT